MRNPFKRKAATGFGSKPPPQLVKLKRRPSIEVTRVHPSVADEDKAKPVPITQRVVILRTKIKKSAQYIVVRWPVNPGRFLTGPTTPALYYCDLRALQSDGVLRFDKDFELPIDESGKFVECPGLEQQLMDSTLDQLADAIQLISAGFNPSRKFYVALGVSCLMAFVLGVPFNEWFPGFFPNTLVHWLPSLPVGFKP